MSIVVWVAIGVEIEWKIKSIWSFAKNSEMAGVKIRLAKMLKNQNGCILLALILKPLFFIVHDALYNELKTCFSSGACCVRIF